MHPSGSKVYMVHKRSGGKSRRVTIGRHGVWSLDAARREAGGIIASLKNGDTPARAGAENGSTRGPTIAELADQYMAEHVAVRCKPTTARSCRHIFDKYLLPQFGGKRLGEITPAASRSAALSAAREGDHGEPGYRVAVAPVPQGREIGLRSRGRQPLSVYQEVPDAKLRAVPVGAGIGAAGHCARRTRGEGQDLNHGGGRAPAADADRMPTQWRS